MGRPNRHRRRCELRSEVVSEATTSGCAAYTQLLLPPSAGGARRSDRPHPFRVPWRRHLRPFRGRLALWVRVVRPRPAHRCPALAPHRVLPVLRGIRQVHRGNHLGLQEHQVLLDNLRGRHWRFLERVLPAHLLLPLPDSLVARRHRGLLDNQLLASANRHQLLASANRHRDHLGSQPLAWENRHQLLAWVSHWREEGSSGHHP